ncbi:V-type ATP synthase subunit K [Candidatus Desantisbacteria bacterium]|nr:V-type ATP synthase subunit K [Candidatus Desantisbacteria bacterium]
MDGFVLVLCGAALAAALPGCGSSYGCGVAGQAGAGVVTEDPEKFGRLLILQALPGTQGIYGLVGLFLVLNKLVGINSAAITISQGWQIVFACLPLAIAGLVSAIYQGRCAAAGCSVVAKRPDEVGKAMIFAVVVETYAILGLLATILLLGNIKLG